MSRSVDTWTIDSYSINVRISELSRQSGVSVASIKYYTREGLLPGGERRGYNQTDYTDAHLSRLRLIRALLEAGGLTIATVRNVVGAIDDPALPLIDAMAAAHHAIPAELTPASTGAMTQVRAVMEEVGWGAIGDHNPGVGMAAGILDLYAAADRPDLGRVMIEYARAAELVAEADLRVLAAAGSRERQVEAVVVGTVLGDVLLAGLRRIAQENKALQHYGESSPPEVGSAS